MVPGQYPAHIPQGPVAENHKGRDHGLFCQLFPQGPKPAEQFLSLLLGESLRQGGPGQIGGFHSAAAGIRLRLPGLPQQYPDGGILQLPDLFGDPQHRIFVRADQQVALFDQAADHFLDFLQGILVQGTEQPLPVESRLFHPGGMAAGQGIGNQVHAVGTARFVDALDNGLGLFRDVDLLEISVAGGTVVAPGWGFLPEIVEHGHAEAGRGGAVLFHGAQFPPVVFLHFLQFFCDRLVLVFQQEFLDHHILGSVEQDAFGRFSVPSGPSGFLVVVLQAGGHVVMEHVAHVGFVDAHTEGIGGDDHRSPVVQEILLGFLPFLLAQSCVVPAHGKVLILEPAVQFVHIFPGGAIDDATVFRMAFQIG